MDEQGFWNAWAESAPHADSPSRIGGIGTLAEKHLHAALKCYYAPDAAHREVSVGRYIADVCDGRQIVEIQTRHLRMLLPKLHQYLPNYAVRVVHPIVRSCKLVWVDPDTGESTPPRKTGRKQTPLHALHEIYGLLPVLGDPSLTVELLLLDVQETRLLDGRGADRKKSATRLQQEPLAAPDSVVLHTVQDYCALLPDGLPPRFTVAQFRKLSKLNSRQAYSAVHVFERLQLLEQDGNEGRAAAYRLRQPDIMK